MRRDGGTPQLELRGISKAFPGCQANDGISLRVMPGEIHALLGENGAGKSTLVKVIYGLLQPDSGTIHWDGRPVGGLDPKAARALGIGMVFQHFTLFEALSVAENIALGLPGRQDLAALSERIRGISESYGLPLAPEREVHALSVGERQRIEIVRCLLQDPRLLIMDEPTSVLTPQEAERLFETLHRLASEGCAILYISHKLEEIRTLCHHATILRAGRVVAECDPTRESARNLAQMMIGEELRPPAHKAGQNPGEALLTVRALNAPATERFGVALEGIALEARAGEIVGIAGVAGNGQNELMALLTGETRAADGESVVMLGRPVGRRGPRARRALGAAFVPEQRLGHGAVPGLTLAENAYLSGYARMGLTAGGLVRAGARDAYARRVIADYDVRTAGIEADAGSLSGGNLQKFIVGREILQEPRLMIVAQPTWGLDAGAAAAIHAALVALAERGSAIVVISQDLDEILALSDRFFVMSEGRLSASLDPRAVSVEEIGLLMGGLQGAGAAEGPEAHAAQA